jgi:hypothetical protein
MLALTVITSYMGLPEFGVQTAPDQEILNELSYEPAHNHMGLLRPVPFEQLVVGAYSTREFAAEPENAEAAIEAFNVELEETGLLEALVGELERGHLDLSRINLSFKPVPPDAPELEHVMEDFARMVQRESQELYNGWGVVIITPNQPGVKRIDIVLNWQEVQLLNGNVQLDENGQPIPLFDDAGNPIRRISSKHIFINENSGYFD